MAAFSARARIVKTRNPQSTPRYAPKANLDLGRLPVEDGARRAHGERRWLPQSERTAAVVGRQASKSPQGSLNPVIGYHGGQREFARFDNPRGSHPSKIGVWFTENREVAARIAERAPSALDDYGTVFECEVFLESPMRYETYRDYLGAWSEHRNDAAALRRALMRKGHDGIVIERSDTDCGILREDFAVFSPRQVDILRVERGLSLAERHLERTADREL